MDAYDVIIIGTGAGGGTLARHLAPSGKRILLLERGDWLPREPQNWLAQDVFVDNRYVSRGHLVRRARQALPAADPLLRRRRDEALRRGALPAARGGLRRAAPPRRRLAGLADLLRRARAVLHAGRAALRGARRARRGPDRAARERAVPVPGGLARAAHPAALRRPRGGRLPPVPRAVRHPAQRVRTCPTAPACAARTATASPALVHGKSDAEVLGVRPALEHPNVTLLTNAQVVRLETNAGRHGGDRGRRRAGRRERAVRAPTSSSLACGAANTAKLLLALGERQAPERARQRLRPGRPQLHVPQQPGGARALARGEPDDLPEDARAERLLLRRRRLRLPARQHPDGRQVAGADVPRREARRDEARAGAGRSSASRSTRSTSGSRPRTCRGPTTASPSTATASSRSRYTADERRAEAAALRASSSRCSASST